MKIVFMGTPDFALEPLKALHLDHEIVCVYAQPPRPAGRGHKLTPSPVHAYATQCGVMVRTPVSLKSKEEQDLFKSLNADVAVVCAYGLILPKACLEAFPYGCLNIHGSILPRWRGAAPIHRAIMAGDTQTGITLMQMDQGLDTGDMLLKQTVDITPTTTTQMLYDQMKQIGAKLVVKGINLLENGKLYPETQPTEGVTYASKISKEEGAIDWHKSADEIERQIRAIPSWFMHKEERIFVLEAQVLPARQQNVTGTILNEMSVACGQGMLKLTKLKRSGKNPLSATDFLRGYDLPIGEVL